MGTGPLRRVLIANRGEIAVRVARACRELGIEAVAAYTADERDAAHVAAADDAVEISGYLEGDAIIAAAGMAGAEAVHPGYGFLAERRGSPRRCCARACAGSARRRRRCGCWATRSRHGGWPRRRGCRSCRATTESTLSRRRAARRGRGRHRLPGAGQGRPPGAAAGHARRRRPGRPARGAGRRAARGGCSVRRRPRCSSSGCWPRPATSRCSCCRRARARGPPWRARLLAAAAAPEGRRGGTVARRRSELRAAHGRGRGGAGPGGRVRERRHRRVPAGGRRQLLLPGAERPPAGGAPGHGGRHRHRPGRAPSSDRGRRAARARAGRHPVSGTPSRRGCTPRIPPPDSCRDRSGHELLDCPGPRPPRRRRLGEGDVVGTALRPAAGQGRRSRRRPRRLRGPAGRGAGRDPDPRASPPTAASCAGLLAQPGFRAARRQPGHRRRVGPSSSPGCPRRVSASSRRPVRTPGGVYARSHRPPGAVTVPGTACATRRTGRSSWLRRRPAGGVRHAPAPGLAARRRCRAGAAGAVDARATGRRRGQVLVLLEAMKMENAVSAPAGGVVRSVLVCRRSTWWAPSKCC